jgi:photosystem II stability/assembly factor-like uncharacterized protein
VNRSTPRPLQTEGGRKNVTPAVTGLPFLRPRTSVTRTADEVAFEKTRGMANWTYLDAYLFWLRQRAFPQDQIEPQSYKNGLQHKLSMKPLQFSANVAAGPQWEFVGPKNLPPPYRQYFGQGYTSGRINGLAFDPIDKNILYVAAAGGGLWQTKNRGSTWQSLSDGDQWLTSSVSSVQIDPHDHDTIFVGTGDFDGGRSIYGFGVMKSIDGGKTWTNLLNQELNSFSVKHILIYPDDSKIVFVTAGNNSSTLGNIWRTQDGGNSWVQAQLTTADWQDVECGKQNEKGKRYCYAVGAGIGGQIWRSDDAGEHWTRLTPPVSSNYQAAFAIAASVTKPETIYLLAGTDRTIWKSTDAGLTWTDTTHDFPRDQSEYIWDQSDYDFAIACSVIPGSDQDIVYVGLIDIVASVDGGGHWASVGNSYSEQSLTHNDQHVLVVNPQDPNEVLLGNDGGVYLLALQPKTRTWTFDSSLNRELGVTQFYRADFSKTDPSQMLGGAQDNATPLASGNLGTWKNIGGGDGGFAAINHQTPAIQYATSQHLTIYRTTNGWQDWDPSLLGGDDPCSSKAVIQKREITFYDEIGGNCRAWWGDTTAFIAPIVLDPNRPNLLYAGTNFLWRWDETTSTWEKHLGEQMLSAGVDDALTTIAIAPSDSKRIYTGSQTGQVWMTADAGQTWTRVDVGSPSLPQYWITSIAVDPGDADTIIVALSGTDSTHPGHLWRCSHVSSDARNWLGISGRFRNALPNVPINSVVIDSADPRKLYVGTDVGFYLSQDQGVTWLDGTRRLGLPNVQVSDLKLVPQTGFLMAATFGRGIWRLPFPLPSLAFGLAKPVSDRNRVKKSTGTQDLKK